MIFACTGVGLLGAILGIVTHIFVKMQMESLEAIKAKQVNEVLKQLEDEEENDANDGLLDDSHKDEQKACLWWLKEASFLVPLVHVCLILVIGTTVVCLTEGWSLLDGLYWCFITSTTIGYGDAVPEKGATLWFSIFFLPLSVAVVTEVLADIAGAMTNRGIENAQKKLFDCQVNVEDLIAMDVDGDGHVTKLEYFEFMLKAMKKVDEELFEQLHAQFARLDADGSGTLEVTDLEILARRKRGFDRTKRTLELAEYRSRLIRLSAQKTPTTQAGGEMV